MTSFGINEQAGPFERFVHLQFCTASSNRFRNSRPASGLAFFKDTQFFKNNCCDFCARVRSRFTDLSGEFFVLRVVFDEDSVIRDPVLTKDWLLSRKFWCDFETPNCTINSVACLSEDFRSAFAVQKNQCERSNGKTHEVTGCQFLVYQHFDLLQKKIERFWNM